MAKIIKLTLLLILPVMLMGADPDANERPWKPYLDGDPIQFKIPPLEEVTLSNGVKVYYRENKLLPKVSITLIFEGGTFEENRENAGITTLWGESVVASGSEQYPRDKLAAYLEQHGSGFYFQSGLERSTFSLSSLSSFFMEDLSVVMSVLLAPRFDAPDVQLIKNQTMEGVKKRGEKPAQSAYLAAGLIEWKGKIRSNIKTIDSITNITREGLVAWHKKMAASNRLTILITGDFDKDKLTAWLEGELPKFTPGKTPLNLKLLAVDPDTRLKQKHPTYLLKKDIPQTSILFRAPGINHAHPDYYALKLFDLILGGNSFSSHLTQVIRTKNGWAYSVYSHYSSGAYTGNITLFMQTANKNVPNVLAKVREILNNPDSFLTELALEEAKSSLRNRYVFLAETPEKLASLQLSLLWEGLLDTYLDDFLKNIDKVTLADLKRIGKKYYSFDRFFITLVGPEPIYSKRPSWLPEFSDVELPR
ncbi:MAG: pitrilysin family protein [Leptospirales bacterium]